MLNEYKCTKCGGSVSHDEAALCKKLINRGLERFMCIHCLSNHFDVSQELLKEKIMQYKKLGCTLFTDNN